MSLMSWLPWALVLVASLIWYWGYLGWETLVRMLARSGGYWFPIGLIVVVDLIAAGRLGADLGLPALFRDDPAVGFSLHSRAVWGACTATYLVGLVWLVIYLFLFIDPANYINLPDESRPIGWNPRAGWAIPCQDVAKFRDHRAALEFLLATTPPFLLLLLTIGAFPADVIGAPAWEWRRAGIGFLEYLGGIAIGIAILYVFVRVTWLLARPIGRLRGRIKARLAGLTIWSRAMRPQTPIQGAAYSTAWAILVTNAILAIYPFLADVMSPSFAIGMLLCLVALGYFGIMGSPRPTRVPMILAIVLFVGWSNGDPYKYRFPGIDAAPNSSYYDKINLDTKGKATGSPRLPLLNDVAVLDAWKARLKEDRPKLVLLAVSGGGYRASFWTATVIDELERRGGPGGDLPGLSDRIRLITGASGGMVGASYYVALRADGLTPANVVKTMKRETKLDSLGRVVQQLVQRDLPLIFAPLTYQKEDRGTVFEDQWKLLDRTFADLYNHELNGSIPSLIVSPMIIETGERLLISNLDVDAIATPHALSGVDYTPSARVFYRRFPGAQDTFKLKTAARMSASFPYVLPAVSLPTDPPARIVDAGYYDNFGVNLAAAWAYENRGWIIANTSGVALIQVNAYPRDADPVTTPTTAEGVVAPVPSAGDVPSSARPATAGDVVAANRQRAFQWLSSPVEGGMAARDWSMFYRNEEQLRLLDDTFNQDGKKRFERFIFTNTGQAALNVIITEKDIALMQTDIARPPNGGESGDMLTTMGQLAAWWKGEAIDPKTKVSPQAPSQSAR